MRRKAVAVKQKTKRNELVYSGRDDQNRRVTAGLSGGKGPPN